MADLARIGRLLIPARLGERREAGKIADRNVCIAAAPTLPGPRELDWLLAS